MKTKKIKLVEASLFSYRAGNSPMHKIPAGIKFVALCVICVRLFAVNEIKYFFQWAELLAYTIFVAICFFMAKMKFSRLRKLKFVIFIGLFVTAFRVFQFFPKLEFNLTEAKIGLLYAARLMISAVAALIVFETTSRREIQDFFEIIEKKLQKIFPPLKKIPLALTISVTISFIPEIFSVWNAIQLAATARTPSGKISISRRIAISTAQISALFSCMIFRAEETRKAIISRKNH